jgi:adenylate cyclase
MTRADLLRVLRKPRFAIMASGALAFLAVAALRAPGALEGQELLAYDLMVAARAGPAAPAASHVTIVAVDDADILRWGWPLSDALLAEAIERMRAGAPSVIGIDLYRDIAYPPGNERLAAALRDGPVVGAAKLPTPGRTAIPGPPALAGSDRVGFTDFPLDPGGVVRRGLLYAEADGETATSFALAVALAHLAREGVAPRPGEADPSHLALGRATLAPFEAHDGGYADADAGGFQFLLDFRRGERPFPVVGLTPLLEGRVPRERLAGRIVLLGIAAESVKDQFATPLSRRTGEPQFGVVVHGEAADQLVRMALAGDPALRVLPGWAELAVIAACALGAVALGWTVRGRWRSAVVNAAALAAIAASAFAAFVSASLWVPVVAALYAWAVGAFLSAVYASRFESAQRATALGLFSRYVPRKVAEDLWERREEMLSESGRPTPRRLVATILFSDIEGFTTLSERMEPARLARWLDEYLNAMAGEVGRAGGVVDKFVGDSVMAVFGVPIAHESIEEQRGDARAAVECALAMRGALAGLNARWRREGYPEVRVRAGIHTGPVVAGSFGNAERLEYTVIGDTVNVASRLEGFDKSPVGPEELLRIHLSDATGSLLDGRFATVGIGDVMLKGKDVPVHVHRLSGTVDAAPPAGKGEGR